ncbi:MAG: pyridoxamine 5'-phosphate oxidase [Saprospiraceae bacterium]
MANLTEIKDLREDYRNGTLEESDLAEHPFQLFTQWFQHALECKIPEPNAMTLATIRADGRPSARIVLLKGFDEQGLVFYTNYESQKGQELSGTPFAAVVFNWLELQQQIRVEGKVERITAAASTDYFQSRPKGSQIGAWASPQSQVIPGREVLEKKVEALQKQYANQKQLPRPDHWGGFRIIPDNIEFWQGRSSRLHDRIRYTLQADGAWKIDRLAP